MRHTFHLLALLSLATFCGNVARADFLINPSLPRTVIFDDSLDTDDDTVRNIPLGFNFDFYGRSVNQIDVSTNGNLNFNGIDAYTNVPLPSYVDMISPLWDDHFIYAGSGQSIYSQQTANLFSVTWDVSQYNDNRPLFQFQATLFGADTTIGSFHFLKNDIAFSYNLVTPDFRLGDATIGLTGVDHVGNGAPARYAALPGDPDGNIGNNQTNLLPIGPGEAILFRVNGDNYDASIITVAVPEPASMAVLAIATVGSIGMRALRKKRARTN